MLQQSDEFSSGMAPDYRLQEPRLQSDLTHLPPPSLPDSCGASSDNGAFALQPPTLGYGQGCYIPPLSRPSVGFPPVGYYSSSVSSYGTNVSASYTSWSSYQPALQYAGAGRDYSLPSSQIFAPPAYPAFSLQPPPPPPPPPSVSSYAGAPPLHHPETLDLPSSFVVLSGRKRQRPVDEDAIEAVDSNLPAKNSRQHHGPSSLEMPTPPDSSSDRSETVSPQSFFHQLHNLPPLQPHSQILPHPPPPAAAVAVSPVVAVPAPPPPQNGVHVTLSTKTEELWNLFYAANTEMIVTKNGRCLFPLLMFSVSGLVRKKEYNILIRAVSSDRYRYKYIHNTWSQVSESEYSHDHNKMEAQHPSSPQTGAKWMAKDVDFKSVKITHYPKSKGGDILLNTMHKYYFEVVIEENNPRSDSEPLVFPFHITQFIAVTAYQSARLTELKKEKNPFARGVKHHESETDGHTISPRHATYDGTVFGYFDYSSAGTTTSVPYPTPWSQNGL